MIFGNPEFQRNIWLRFSPWRLIAMPMLLALFIGIFAATADPWSKGLPTILEGLIFIVLFLWGIYEAAKAPTEELRDKTWDFQKMSSLGPWQLTLGKLFGATSYVWYVGLALIAVQCIAQLNNVHNTGFGLAPVTFDMKSPSIERILYGGIITIVSALIGQSTAFFLGLFHLKTSRSSVIRQFIGGFLVGSVAQSLASLNNVVAIVSTKSTGTVEWLGMHIQPDTFANTSLLFILGWLLIGNQRLMRLEIGFKNRPVGWGLFVITFGIYLAGVVGGAPFKTGPGLAVFYLFAIFCAYCVMLTEARDLTTYRKFLYGLWNGPPRIWQENLPKWAVALAVALALLPLILLSSPDVEQNKVHNVVVLLFCLMLFVIRDGVIFHALLLSPKSRYGYFSVGVYLLVVYILLPLLVTGTSASGLFEDYEHISKTVESTKLINTLFFPVATAEHPAYMLPVLGEIMIGIIFLRNRIASFRTDKTATLPSFEQSK